MALAHSDSLGELGQVDSEPTGYPMELDSSVTTENTISFNELTRTFSITPTGADFHFYVKGVKYVKKAAENIQISNIDGLHFIYYEKSGSNAILVDDENPPINYLLSGVAFTCNVYWNSVQQRAIIFGEERHGHVMDWATHNRMHYVDHARYVSGFALGNFSIDGDGSLDSHIQFSCGDGIFKDEDIEHTIVNGVVQNLSPILNAPILYRMGASNLWYISDPTPYPVKTTGTGRAAYNQLVGGSWVQTEVTNGRYMLMHVFVTNDKRYPIMIIQGVNEYNNKGDARTGAETELTTLSGLPFVEFIAIGTIIVQTSNIFTNTVKSIIVSTDAGDSYVDFRNIVTISPGAAADHGSLGGLYDYDHPQYAKALVNGDTVPQSYARITYEPTGFPNTTDSIMTFSDVTRTLTIAPVSGSFSYYNRGVLKTKSVPITYQISNVEGIHFIYIDENDSFQELVNNENHELLYRNVYCAAIRWDGTNLKRVYFGEERHQYMPWQDHVNHHEGHGTLYLNGLAIGNIISTGDGSLDSHATLSLTDGQIRDEDILHTIANGIPQVLTPIAQIPVLYKEGAGNWRKNTTTNFPVKSFVGGSGRLAYNQDVAGVWQQTEVPNNDFVLCHLFATNDKDNPIIAIQGENYYTTTITARAGATIEIKNLFWSGMPEEEFVPIATIIYQTGNTYANTVKAKIVQTDTGGDYIDWLFYGGSKLLLLRNVG